MAKKTLKRTQRSRTTVKKKQTLFITFEGIEGSGKSSVIAFVKKYLTAKGLGVIVYREPGSTRVGEKIRSLLLDKRNKRLSPHTELLLYLAARTQLIEEKLLSAFGRYDVIICDRFFDSTLVYQGYALGLGKVADSAVTLFSLGVIPDITIVLDTDVDSSLGRLSRKKDRIESRPRTFHRLLKEGYRMLARRYPARIRLVKAEKDLKIVCGDVQKIIEAVCWKKRRVKL